MTMARVVPAGAQARREVVVMHPLKEARLRAGLSLDALARVCGPSISRWRLTHWEHGRSRPSDLDLLRVCGALGLDYGLTRLRLGLLTPTQSRAIADHPAEFLAWCSRTESYSPG